MTKIITGIDGFNALNKLFGDKKLPTFDDNITTTDATTYMFPKSIGYGKGLMEHIQRVDILRVLEEAIDNIVTEMEVIDLDIKYYLLEEYNYQKLRNLMFKKALLEMEYEELNKKINNL